MNPESPDFQNFNPETSGNQKRSEELEQFVELKDLHGHVETVPVFGTGKIEVSENGEEATLITEKLNGCTATIIWTESADGTRSAQLVHFPPFMLQRHLDGIGGQISEEDLSAVEKHALLYFASNRRENEKAITEHIRSALGEDTVVEVRAYDPSSTNGIFGIRLRSKNEGEVEYLTD